MFLYPGVRNPFDDEGSCVGFNPEFLDSMKPSKELASLLPRFSLRHILKQEQLSRKTFSNYNVKKTQKNQRDLNNKSPTIGYRLHSKIFDIVLRLSDM